MSELPIHIKPFLRLAGLEPLVIRPETNFVNVGSFIQESRALSARWGMKHEIT
jgi:hypothetical protein